MTRLFWAVIMLFLGCAALWQCGGCAVTLGKTASLEYYTGVRSIGPEDGTKSTVEFSSPPIDKLIEALVPFAESAKSEAPESVVGPPSGP